MTHRHSLLTVLTGPRKRFAPPRRGAVLIVMMVNLFLVSVMMVSLLRLTVDHRRQLRYERQRLQADWLAESGLERAASRIRSDPDYKGEVWIIPAAELGDQAGGKVQIEIEPVEGSPSEKFVSVAAVFPNDAVRFATRTKKLKVNVQPKS